MMCWYPNLPPLCIIFLPCLLIWILSVHFWPNHCSSYFWGMWDFRCFGNGLSYYTTGPTGLPDWNKTKHYFRHLHISSLFFWTRKFRLGYFYSKNYYGCWSSYILVAGTKHLTKCSLWEETVYFRVQGKLHHGSGSWLTSSHICSRERITSVSWF